MFLIGLPELPAHGQLLCYVSTSPEPSGHPCLSPYGLITLIIVALLLPLGIPFA